MDREIDESVLRQRRVRRVTTAVAAVAILAAGFATSVHYLKPSVERRSLRTARVTRGPVKATIDAAGTVVPAYEKVITTPIDSRVLTIHTRAGVPVSAGTELLELDTWSTRLALDRNRELLSGKENQMAQLRLRLEESLADLSAKREQKRLDIEMLRFKADQNRALHRDGLLPESNLREAETALRKGEIELAQLDGQVATSRRSTDAQLRGVELELATLRRERQDLERELELASTRSDRDGVVTWIVTQEGSSVRRGEVIARVADLQSFRIEGTVSDIHSSRLRLGMPVDALLDSFRTTGRVAQISPSVSNGTVSFTVDLDKPSDPNLRDKQRVELRLITGERAAVLRIPRGSYLSGELEQAIFVVNGDRAVRRTVRIGSVSADAVEIVSGLAEGDEVILSDMSDVQHAREVRLE